MDDPLLLHTLRQSKGTVPSNEKAAGISQPQIYNKIPIIGLCPLTKQVRSGVQE
jgi:hypothetical protein